MGQLLCLFDTGLMGLLEWFRILQKGSNSFMLLVQASNISYFMFLDVFIPYTKDVSNLRVASFCDQQAYCTVVMQRRSMDPVDPWWITAWNSTYIHASAHVVLSLGQPVALYAMPITSPWSRNSWKAIKIQLIAWLEPSLVWTALPCAKMYVSTEQWFEFINNTEILN